MARQSRPPKRRDTHRKGTPGYADQIRAGRSKRGKKKEAARAVLSDAVIEDREGTTKRNPLYLNSCPAKRYAEPWPEKPAAKKRRKKTAPRAASTYRAARRNAEREAKRAARKQRAPAAQAAA